MKNLPKDAKSGILVYHPQRTSYQEHPKAEFAIFVDLDNYGIWKDDPSKTNIRDICQTDEVFFIRTGSQTGEFERPGKDTLENEFGTADFGRIVEFMVEHGNWKPFDSFGKRNFIKLPQYK